MSQEFEMLATVEALGAYSHHLNVLHDVGSVFADRCNPSIFAPSFVGHDIGAFAVRASLAAAHGRIDLPVIWIRLVTLLPSWAAFTALIRAVRETKHKDSLLRGRIL